MLPINKVFKVIDIYSTVHIQYCIKIHILDIYSTGKVGTNYMKIGATGVTAVTCKKLHAHTHPPPVVETPVAKGATK
jgi:coenzyme F420-reducing hydrogenase delta subunit